MNDHLKLTEKGAKLIQHFEGCLKPHEGKFKAYKCPANVLTIGWGHTNHHGRQFDAATRWTAKECHQVFLEDMEGFERDVRKAVKVPLTDYQFDALVSFTYNCGSGALNVKGLRQPNPRRSASRVRPNILRTPTELRPKFARSSASMRCWGIAARASSLRGIPP